MRATVRLIVLPLLAAACAGPPDDPPGSPQTPLQSVQLRSGSERGSASGLGCGLVVTARHVVGDRDDAILVSGGRDAPARVIARSPHLDLAVLRTEPGLLDAPPSASARPGDRLQVLGAPDGHSEVRSGMFRRGPEVIGPLGAYAHATTPDLRPGFSGGPVMDTHGRRVGMLVGRCRSAPDEIVLLPESGLRAEAARLVGAGALRGCAPGRP